MTRWTVVALGGALGWAGACVRIAKPDREEIPADTTQGSGGFGGTSCVPEACPGVDTDCRFRLCEEGACALNDVQAGTPCEDATEPAGKVCSGTGRCVECSDESHCPSGQLCSNDECVPPSCTDGVANGDESGVDCGGSCPPCEGS